MKKDRILDIFQGFAETKEYDNKLKEVYFDLPWLEERLNSNDVIYVEEIFMKYGVSNHAAMFKSGFLFAWQLFEQCTIEEGKSKMNEKLSEIFEVYKDGKWHKEIDESDIELDWLGNKLGNNDIKELEGQIMGIVLEREEKMFINCFKYAFGLFRELEEESKK